MAHTRKNEGGQSRRRLLGRLGSQLDGLVYILLTD